MIQIILILLVIGLVFTILKAIWKALVFLFKAGMIIGLIVLAIAFYQITIPLLILYFIRRQISKFKYRKSIKQRIAEKPPAITDIEVDDIMLSVT